MSNLLKNLVLLLSATVFALLMMEAGVRLVKPSYDPTSVPRFLMFSSQTFAVHGNGSVRYLPNERIRTLAVYDEKVVYDVQFETNNLGFVDSVDYEYEAKLGKKYYAFVGDSFTAGFHGGDPWVPALRDNVGGDTIQIYNLGVSGTGIQQFAKLLESTAGEISITHIVIIFISLDFGRELWYPLTTSQEIRFCNERLTRVSCAANPFIAKVVREDSSTEEVLQVARSLGQQRGRPRKPYEGARSALWEFVRGSISSIRVKPWHEEVHIDGRSLEHSLDALGSIRETFPNTEVHLVHLPLPSEVVAGVYLLRDIDNLVARLGFAYFPALEECEWSQEMFHVEDGHPNQYGYDSISNCVSGYLFGRE